MRFCGTVSRTGPQTRATRAANPAEKRTNAGRPARSATRNSAGITTTGMNLMLIESAAATPAVSGAFRSTRRWAATRAKVMATASVLPWYPEVAISTGLAATPTPQATAAPSEARLRTISNTTSAQKKSAIEAGDLINVPKGMPSSDSSFSPRSIQPASGGWL